MSHELKSVRAKEDLSLSIHMTHNARKTKTLQKQKGKSLQGTF